MSPELGSADDVPKESGYSTYQPDIALIISTDTSKWCRISSFETNTGVMRAAKITASSSDGLECPIRVNVLDGVSKMPGVISSVSYIVSKFEAGCEEQERIPITTK
jgi:hypothetical protein